MVDRDYDTKAYEDGVRAGRQEMQAEIERLRAEVKTWVGHTKTAVWSDSKQCKLLEAEIERLRAALTEIRDAGPMTVDDQRWRIARAALEGKQ